MTGGGVVFPPGTGVGDKLLDRHFHQSGYVARWLYIVEAISTDDYGTWVDYSAQGADDVTYVGGRGRVGNHC